MNNIQTREYPTLILVRGLPGSGKSYLATRLQEAIGQDKVVLLDPDFVDDKSQEYLDHCKQQVADGVDPKLWLYRYNRLRAQNGITSDKVVIWNQPFTDRDIFNKMNLNLQTHAATHGVRLAALVVDVILDPSIAKARIEYRKSQGGHGPSDDTFEHFTSEYVSFSEDYKTITVNGDDDVAISVATVKRAMTELDHEGINIKDNLASLLSLVTQTDTAIMDIYNSGPAVVEIKDDKTPITQADKASHKVVISGLKSLYPDIPIVSEEASEQENALAMHSSVFWLVDPIDGTREFINKTGEFTICVGLIENNVPTFGIVSAPALGVTYYGGPYMGSYKIGDGRILPIRVSATKLGIVLAGGSHGGVNDSTAEYIADKYPASEIRYVGSQLKFVYIAEGRADAFPRLGSTMKTWDFAAGHAILVGAGGSITTPDDRPLDYRPASFQIGDFVAKSS